MKHRSKVTNDRIHFGLLWLYGYENTLEAKHPLRHRSGCHGWRDSFTTVVVDAAMKTPMRHRSRGESKTHPYREEIRFT